MGEPPTLTESTRMDKIRGITFGIIMLLSAFFGSVFVMMPLVPLIWWQPYWYRRWVDRLVGFWLVMPSSIMEFVFGVQFTVTGDLIDHQRPGIIIMNHRTRLDWLFFWNALFRMNPWLLTTEKITLKGILKYLPGAGWAMGSNAYIFLDRSYENDSARIDNMLEYYAKVGSNYQLLLFPEGTDKCPKATARSKEFAEKKNIVHYDYVLHPRVTGFIHIVKKMREEKYIDFIYDVTIAFNDCILQSEVDLVRLGVTSKDVRFDVRKIPIADVPLDDAEIGEWLRQLWAEKEERLRQFYSLPQSERELDTHENALDFALTPAERVYQVLIIGVWMSMLCIWMYFFFTTKYAFLMSMATVAFYIGLQKIYNGSEVYISQVGLDYHKQNGIASKLE